MLYKVPLKYFKVLSMHTNKANKARQKMSSSSVFPKIAELLDAGFSDFFFTVKNFK